MDEKVIPVPGPAYYSKRAGFWREKAAIMSRVTGQPVRFAPVSPLEWDRMAAENRAAVRNAKAIERAAKAVADADQHSTLTVNVREHWVPRDLKEWEQMDAEINRMYDLGELGRKAVAFGAAGAVHTAVQKRRTVPSAPAHASASAEASGAAGAGAAAGAGVNLDSYRNRRAHARRLSRG